jgi:hypothetical protein
MLLSESRWRAGDTIAITEAVRALIRDLVRERGMEEWWWLADAVEQLVDRRMPDDEKRARREFEGHLYRWEAVTELHERRFELLERGDDRGMSLEKCFDAVSEMMGNSYDTVRKSYQLIQNAGGKVVTLESYKAARAAKVR